MKAVRYNVLYVDVGESYVPIQCDALIKKAVLDRNMLNAHDMYSDMPLITGVPAKHATYEDFQRRFNCPPYIKTASCHDVGLQFPRSCSHPPCDLCRVDYQSKLNEIWSKILYKLHSLYLQHFQEFIFIINFLKLKMGICLFLDTIVGEQILLGGQMVKILRSDSQTCLLANKLVITKRSA